MTRTAVSGGLLILLMVTSLPSLLGQSNSSAKKDALDPKNDARTRRANRESAIAKLAPVDARDFVETYGDAAVEVISSCSHSTAVKLTQFHASGALGKLPRPHALLRVIADPRYGDDVAFWAIAHASELTDTDSFEAYLADPLEYALGLKPLTFGAARARESRLAITAPVAAEAPRIATPPQKSFLDDDRFGAACTAGLLVIIGFGVWRRRRSSGG